MPERLQKIISESGLTSRRSAEKLISKGRVTVNGHTAVIGEKADPETDFILIDGKPLSIGGEKVYVMLNKPRGYVTTMSDEKCRKDVSMLTADAGVRLYPVGRLDLNSEGLLIMTNDGEFANRLMHPSNNILKTYEVIAAGEDISSAAERLSAPFNIDGTVVKAKNVELKGVSGNSAMLHVTIGEGKNREVRKMCAQAGLRVLRLRRIREGSLELGDLRSGHWRRLTQEEIDSFYTDEGSDA